jgi:AI-2 transport protein TqsA
MFRFFVTAAAIAVLVLALRAMASFLSIVLLAILLTYSLSPIPLWLMRKRVPKIAAVLLTILLLLVGGSVLVWLIGESISQTTANLPAYQERLIHLKDSIITFLAHHGIHAENLLSVETPTTGRLLELARTVLSAGGQIVGDAILIFVLIIAMLFEIVEICDPRVTCDLPTRSLMSRFTVFSNDIQRYVSVTALTGLLIAGFFYIALVAMGIGNAPTWAILCFFLNFIPTFGAILTVAPPALLTWVTSGFGMGAAVALSFIGINSFMEYLVKPKLIKHQLGISPLMVLISLVFWTWVLGPLGTILAVPLTVALRRVLRFKSGIFPAGE